MIHVQTWSGSRSATVTDMAFAGKRGKKCRQLVVRGACWDRWAVRDNPVMLAAVEFSDRAYRLCELIGPDISFDTIDKDFAEMEQEARTAGVPENYFKVYREEIRGVDAPRVMLTAGVPEVWSASADERGIRLHNLRDVNEWTEITSSSQSKAKAYEIARKVWDRVKQAATLHEASDILGAAGAKLHGFCALD